LTSQFSTKDMKNAATMRQPCRIPTCAMASRRISPFVSALFLFWIYWIRLNSNTSLIDVNGSIASTENESVIKKSSGNGASSAYSSVANKAVQVRDHTSTKPEDRARLEPIRILEEYKQQHSRQALSDDFDATLHHEPDNGYRRFALVTYWCPDRAGNILHNLFNSMAWAVLTNRTILWQYSDNQNTEQDCQQVMKRADWMAGWEEWSQKLQLETPKAFPWDDFPKNPPQVVIFPQIRDVLNKDKSIDRNSWRDDPMQRQEDQKHIQSMGPDIASRATSLYAEGVNFLLGLLFRETFELQVGENPTNTPKGVSIAIHSRHPVNGDDGSFVDEEKECMAQLLTKHINGPYKGLGCHVYLMSDRKATVDLLSAWAKMEFNCTPVVAAHSASHVQKMEHGPWDGVGFIEDLASASLARTAAVGDLCRSSFMLLAELVEYEQRMEAWRENRPTEALEICKLQNKALKGYDYGPGTPTFIRHNTRPALAPVKALKEYKKWHSQRLEMEGDREYVVVDYSCIVPEKGTGHGVHSFLNSVIFAIATNRTILLNKIPGAQCNGIQSLDSWIPVYDSNLTLPTNWIDKSEFLPAKSSKLQCTDVQQGLLLSLEPESSQATAQALFTEGNDFLYGMIFFESFHLAAAIQAGTPTDYVPSTEFALNTIALHVDSESTTENVLECLEKTIDSSLPCHVYMMMTDPQMMEDGESLNLIHQWLSGRNCTVWNASRYNSDGATDEERPYQLFRDLHFAAKAKAAFIGPLNMNNNNNPYSEMLLEWMEYRRRNHIWKDGRFPPLHSPSLTKCIL
jgi:hypothetical protein